MAIMMECDECGFEQLVGVIDNGLPGGFPDPHHPCSKCGTLGRFSAIGTRERIEQQAAAIARLPEVQKLSAASARLLDRCEGMGI